MKKKERNQTGRATNGFKSLGYTINYVGKNGGPDQNLLQVMGFGIFVEKKWSSKNFRASEQ
jgi:hypothetical protein